MGSLKTNWTILTAVALSLTTAISCGSGSGKGATGPVAGGGTPVVAPAPVSGTEPPPSDPPIDPGGGDPTDPFDCTPPAFTPNYCSETEPGASQPNKIHWWNHLPLKVYFTTAPTLQGKDINNIVMSGLNMWSDYPITAPVAKRVMTQAEAEIVVSYQQTPTMPGGWIGQALFSYFPFNMQAISGTITIKLWDNMSADQVNKGIKQTAQHEYGHILFLEGHSPVGVDAMYPSADPSQFRSLTTRDKNSVREALCGMY